jgi:hypothetical protein
VSQVSDIVEVLVRGGVSGQFAQVVGDVAGADGAGGVQGRVSNGGGLDRIAGGHGETGQFGQADRPRAGVACGVPVGCRGESVDGLGEIGAGYREVEQGMPGVSGEEGSVVIAQEWRVIRAAVRICSISVAPTRVGIGVGSPPSNSVATGPRAASAARSRLVRRNCLRSTCSSFTAARALRALTNPSAASVETPRIARRASRDTLPGQRICHIRAVQYNSRYAPPAFRGGPTPKR